MRGGTLQRRLINFSSDMAEGSQLSNPFSTGGGGIDPENIRIFSSVVCLLPFIRLRPFLLPQTDTSPGSKK